jgi:hypothetical protein
MDMRFGTWNVGSMYRAGSLRAVAEEISKYWDQWKECIIQLLYQFTRMAIKVTVVIIGGYHCCQLHTKFYPIFYSQG